MKVLLISANTEQFNMPAMPHIFEDVKSPQYDKSYSYESMEVEDKPDESG